MLLGDLPEGVDQRIQNMEQMVFKAQNLTEQLCMLANDLPAQDHFLISNHLDQEYQADP
jgi:hypothetical protein